METLGDDGPYQDVRLFRKSLDQFISQTTTTIDRGSRRKGVTTDLPFLVHATLSSIGYRSKIP